MSYEPSRFRRSQTLRFRLMVWNALVVLITAVVTLIGLREAVRITLFRELDQLLREDVREIELALVTAEAARSELLHQQLDRKDAGHAQHKWFVQLFDRQGHMLFQTQHAPQELPDRRTPADTAQSVDAWRFLEHRVGELTIRVGASTEQIRGDIARIDRLLAMAAGMVLFMAPLCGYWLAGRATRPLNDMISTVSKLQPAQLEDRLVIRGSGDELDRLSVTFNRLLDRIGSYLQDRRDFLANAAHELRTPLAAIRSSVEVALNKPRTVAEYESLLREVISESGSLELLVNQLLLLSEVEAEKFRDHVELVPLNELLEKAIDMFGGVAEFQQVQLMAKDLPAAPVKGNSQHLRQVVYNLLDNALKFTPAGGQVEVDLECLDRQILLTVRDTGVGVLEKDLPKLFDRFFQGETGRNPKKRSRGTGLGLCICRSIVRAHDGEITIASRPNEGTCVSVYLPRVAPDQLPKWDGPKTLLAEPT